MLKTSAVTLAALLLAYPMLGSLMPYLGLTSPIAVLFSLYVVAVFNGYVITRFIK